MKTKKKVMTAEQLNELLLAEGAFSDWREDVASKKANLREAERDTCEAQANLKNEKKLLAKTVKDTAIAKKKFDKLKAKYKGWAKPKPAVDESLAEVPEGMP